MRTPNGKRHGNRRDNPEETYLYKITVDGQPRKLGIGSGGLDDFGGLKRAQKQVDKLTKRFPDQDVDYDIRKIFSDRSKALDYEKNVLDRYKRRFGSYPGEGLPGGNKINR